MGDAKETKFGTKVP